MYETAKKLYDAYRAEKKKPALLNGRAQPIFPYTTGEKTGQATKYEDSQIVRFPVMSKRTTTPTQMANLTWSKPLFNLPKAVAQGDFRQPLFWKRAPYVAGTRRENYVTLESLGLPTDGSYDMKKLHSQPARERR